MKIMCPECHEAIVREDFANLVTDITNGVIIQYAYGFCPVCGKDYEWEETLTRTKVDHLREKE